MCFSLKIETFKHPSYSAVILYYRTDAQTMNTTGSYCLHYSSCRIGLLQASCCSWELSQPLNLAVQIGGTRQEWPELAEQVTVPPKTTGRPAKQGRKVPWLPSVPPVL